MDLLVMGWPLGHGQYISDARWYVRNPPNDLNFLLLSEWERDLHTVPADAHYTAYHDATYELWLSPSDQDVAAYLRTGGNHFERWPRAKQALYCA